MQQQESPQPKKTLHPKRSLASKHPNLMHLHSSSQPIDSPAYDASEEDNDPLTDDAASTVSVATSASSLRPSAPPRPPQNSSMRPPPGPPAGPIKTRHALVASMLSSDEGVDSPTYDGDVESSTTAGPDDRISSSIQKSSTVSHHHYNSSASIASNSVSPITPSSQFPVDPATSMKLPELTPPLPTISVSPQQRHHHAHTVPRPTPSHPSKPTEPPPANISTAAFNPAKLSPLDIQDFVREVIEEGITVGTGAEKKVYKINEPPTWRPVRIYADGESAFLSFCARVISSIVLHHLFLHFFYRFGTTGTGDSFPLV